MTQKTTKPSRGYAGWRPKYPTAAECDDLIKKLRTKRATTADLDRAVTILRESGISGPSEAKKTERALKGCLGTA